jgi:hypothetical protein
VIISLTVPNTIIEGGIKAIGIPESPGICGDKFYQKLKRKISLRQEEKREGDTSGTLEERENEYEIKRRYSGPRGTRQKELQK